jgi:hypothetical protein
VTRDTRTLLLAVLADENVGTPEAWAVETILEFAEREIFVDEFIPDEFDYEYFKNLFCFMYFKLLLDQAEATEGKDD